ncbi:MAG: glycine cleavage system protein H [candidate division Zixibacteria bacterium HGW-Zixibacteria-1]|nr:MAG: glycine cleavage system protein H [candidate division Zixibacteria bacterium HGW-Zixibacteria-1]
MDIPAGLRYTKEHEWLKIEGNTATVGITEYAQGELGDIVFVELPAEGTIVKAMQPFGTIEAVKAVSDLFSPVSGKVVAVNPKLEDDPMIINREPFGGGWMIKLEISNMEEVNRLLTADSYKKLVE